MKNILKYLFALSLFSLIFISCNNQTSSFDTDVAINVSVEEIVKKPYYDGWPMVWSETRKKWYVINGEGDWLEFAGKKSDIEWRIIK